MRDFSAARLWSFDFLCADGNIRNKYALFGARHSSGFESFHESSVDWPWVWGWADDQVVEDLGEIQIGD